MARARGRESAAGDNSANVLPEDLEGESRPEAAGKMLT